jgi:2-keto-3-deoxy-L-rhamnonate aldolase RhmA
MATSLRAAIEAANGPALGTFVKVPAPEITEIIARSGFDFVVIDTEHALLSVRDVYSMIVVYSGLGVVPLVRVSDHGYGDAQRYLDAGAAGVLVPHVSNVDQAQQVTRQLLFPPEGTRGMGFAGRAGQWGGLPGGRAEYLRYGQQDAVRMAMIEDAEAVGNVAEILETDGLDAVFVGPGDLSLSLGVAAGDAALGKALDTVITAAVAAGVPAGTVVTSPDEARRRAEQGCGFLMVGNDTGLIRTAATTALTSHRAAVAGS